MRPCDSCKVEPGALHVSGCSIEACPLCGGQAISCDCAFRVSGIEPATLEETDPELWEKGPTDEMWEAFDARIASVGGRLPWAGEYPGSAEAREFGYWCRRVEPSGWERCVLTDEGAVLDLSRLFWEARWDIAQRRWVRRLPV